MKACSLPYCSQVIKYGPYCRQRKWCDSHQHAYQRAKFSDTPDYKRNHDKFREALLRWLRNF